MAPRGWLDEVLKNWRLYVCDWTACFTHAARSSSTWSPSASGSMSNSCKTKIESNTGMHKMSYTLTVQIYTEEIRRLYTLKLWKYPRAMILDQCTLSQTLLVSCHPLLSHWFYVLQMVDSLLYQVFSHLKLCMLYVSIRSNSPFLAAWRLTVCAISFYEETLSDYTWESTRCTQHLAYITTTKVSLTDIHNSVTAGSI